MFSLKTILLFLIVLLKKGMRRPEMTTTTLRNLYVAKTIFMCSLKFFV